jgi:hypothetical protein
MASELAFSLLFEKEVDGDRASRGRRSCGQALADTVHERRFDEACQALIGKQVPGPISFTSAEEPCRTAVLKAFQKICLLPNSPGGILLRWQDLDLVLTVLQMVANMEPVQLIGFSFVSPSATSSIGKILPIIMPGELADINGHHLIMGLREMFSPCILDNFIAECYDRITSNAISHQGQRPAAGTKDFFWFIIKELDLALQTGVFPRDHSLDILTSAEKGAEEGKYHLARNTWQVGSNRQGRYVLRDP